ncbi:hypothetical protein MUN84_07000 [Hymenobacter sp. 5516J-16]|uniref:hypothetical protein n=1 Tax=Hymenobacter sp. 5516J-16 TaxID=2932253 RepID=UPI001FD37D60|nr:hypothetical protein [Hymenobacter sp. 5516J-16]UOQ78321.1 hypothetical protein MUN84_07000 [Hymenobacter sp. 5516J-16]
MSAASFCRAYLRFVLVAGSVASSLVGRTQTLPVRTSSRVAPGLEANRAGRALRVSVTNPAAFQQWLTQHQPRAVATAEPRHAGLWQVRGVTPAELTQCPWVSFVEVADRRAQPERQLNTADLAANKVTTVHARYPALAGQGLTVSVKESPLDINDIDFKGRLVNPDPQAQLLNSHATIMATLIAGGGNSAVTGKGPPGRPALHSRATITYFLTILLRLPARAYRCKTIPTG